MLVTPHVLQVETVGELRDAVHATSLDPEATTEHELLARRLAFDPYLFAHEGREPFPDEHVFIDNFDDMFTPSFRPSRVVEAMRKVVDAEKAKQVLDPSPADGEPSQEYMRMLKRGQTKLAKRVKPVVEAFDQSYSQKVK